MKKLFISDTPATKSTAEVAAILITACTLGACSHVPGPPRPVQLPIDVEDGTAVPSARLSWHESPISTRAGSFALGFEIDYARGIGRTEQSIGTNEFIELDRKTLSGPQDVSHHADLRQGHIAFNGIWRFPGKVSRLELEWIAGFGETHLGLRSESRTAQTNLTANYTLNGITLGFGPRWNFTDTLAAEARIQAISSPTVDDTFSRWEIGLRYRPVENVAIRAGYAEMKYGPSKKSGDDSPVHVRLYGPFLGLHLLF